MEGWIASLLAWLALPQYGLSTVFVVTLVSATLLPLASEPAVFGLLKINPDLFWQTMVVATAGNTTGGLITYAMGYGARHALHRERQTRWFGWLQRFGPKTLLLSWLPVIGDPLCALAGWLGMPVLQSAFYMALGKLLRYLTMTTLLIAVPDSFWHRILHWV